MVIGHANKPPELFSDYRQRRSTQQARYRHSDNTREVPAVLSTAVKNVSSEKLPILAARVPYVAPLQ